MKRKTFEQVMYAIMDEASRDSLVDLLEAWGLTMEDYEEFEELVNELAKTLED